MSGGIAPCGLAYETDYAQTMEKTILPYNGARRNDGMFDGFDGKKLFMSLYTADDPKGTVVMVHGFTESSEKWQELIYSLLNRGYNVCAYDARGHGRSWRDERLGGDLTLTHIDRFEDYVVDLGCFREKTVRDDLPRILFCHSMGGAAGAMYLEKYKSDCGFDKAVLNSPMIAPNRGRYPMLAAKGLCDINILLGRGCSRSINSRPYPGYEVFEDSAASGKARFDWYEKIKSSTPEFQNYCSTYKLTAEFLKVTSYCCN